MKKKLSMITALILTVCVFNIPVFAQDINEVEDIEGIEPKVPACVYDVYYSESTRSKNPYDLTTGYFVNDLGTEQRVTVSKSRSATFSGNLSVSAEVNLVTSVVGGSIEVGYGTTTTTTISVTTDVPAHTTYMADMGAMLLVTTGNIVTRNNDCSLDYKSSTLKWTTGDYVRWYE